MIKILITGTNGHLGKKLIPCFSEDIGVRVIAVSRGLLRHPLPLNAVYEPMDITDRARVKIVFDQYRPNIVIHTAAMTHTDTCEIDPETAWRINVTGTENITEACRQHQAFMIHLSTDFIFDGKEGPYRENDRTNPLSHYGRSKLVSEEIVKKAGISWAIVRTCLAYGFTPDASRLNILTWAKQSLEKGQKIRLVFDQFRTPTLMEDLTSGTREIALRKLPGIYHLSGCEMMSIHEFVLKAADIFKLNPALIEAVPTAALKEPAQRPPRTGFVIDKARKAFGFNPRLVSDGILYVKQQIEASARS